jgi:hypothetical protein
MLTANLSTFTLLTGPLGRTVKTGLIDIRYKRMIYPHQNEL